MALEFSSKDDKIINQSLDLGTVSQTPSEDLDNIYEIPRCVRWIQDNEFQNVCLQFPDCLLKDSVAVYQKIRNQTKAKIYILADTTYGSCCVDEIAAEHVNGDAVIHFGHSCLSPVQKLPVLFVFGKETIDCHHVAEEFQKLLPKPEAKIILIYAVTYYHALDDLKKELLSVYPNAVISELKIPETAVNRKCERELVSQSEGQENFTCCQNKYGGHCNQSERKYNESVSKSDTISEFPVSKCEDEETNQFCKLGRVFPIKECNIGDYCIFYIGDEGCCLSTFLMTFNKCTFYTYNPSTQIARLETLNINKALMRRYYLIEQAKDAKVVGIVVGTLGVSNFRNIIDQLRSTLLKAGKKVYVLAMGKPNVAKLANFPEIDIFVLVACPENSLLDSKEFFRPVITPFEMDIACNQARTWTGDYITDFAELLPGASGYVPVSDNNDDNEETNVSLISGKLRTTGISKNIERSDNNELIKRSEILTVAPLHEGGAGEFLSQRSWKGLEQQLGETPTAILQDGQHGIAAGYSHECTSEVVINKIKKRYQ